MQVRGEVDVAIDQWLLANSKHIPHTRSHDSILWKAYTLFMHAMLYRLLWVLNESENPSFPLSRMLQYSQMIP